MALPSDATDSHSRIRLAASCVLLAVASLLFWRFRVIGPSTAFLTWGGWDLWLEHTPMAEYGFRELAAGHLPLWNPFELFGQPFLATYYVGVFYPLHFVYALFDVELATELSYLMHMALGAISFSWLVRSRGLGWIAASVGALAFVWSGYLSSNVHQASLFASLCWIPLLVACGLRTLDGAPRAWLWMAVAVGMRILLGGIEIFVHTVLALGLMALVALANDPRADGAGGRTRVVDSVRRLALLSISMLAGVLLATPQLLPSIELVGQSVRGQGAVLDFLSLVSFAPLGTIFSSALQRESLFGIGLLPLVAMPLAFGAASSGVASSRVSRQVRGLAWGGALMILLAALLAGGGFFFDLYNQLPVIGGMFRRPIKFLALYAFGGSLVAACVVQAMLDRTSASGDAGQGLVARVGTDRWLLASVVSSVVVVAASLALDRFDPWLTSCAAAVVAFACAPPGRARIGLALVAAAANVLSGFVAYENEMARPYTEPELRIEERSIYLDVLPDRDELEGRIYVAGMLATKPAFASKQGVTLGMPFAVGYSPLALDRVLRFLQAAIDPEGEHEVLKGVFSGTYPLRGGSNLELLDAAGLRYYLVNTGSRTRQILRRAATRRDGTVLLRGVEDIKVEVFERTTSSPRARLVDRVIPVDSLAAAEVALREPRTEWATSAVVEVSDAARARWSSALQGRGRIRSSRVEVVVDRPERLEIEVTSPRDAMLVISDSYYPGWRAERDGEPVDILPANAAFRAVPVKPGTQRIVLEYRSAPLSLGLVLSGGTALALLGAVALERRRERAAA